MPGIRRSSALSPFLSAVALALLCLAGCATSTKVISPGPVYYGETEVTKVAVYLFIDMRPEYLPEAFKRVVTAKLEEALQQSGIRSEQVWFADTAQGRILLSDVKSRTFYNATSVSVGATIRDNSQQELRLRPSHRIIVFPSETLKSGNGAVLNVKWDVTDARTGNVEWSVYTRTPVLSSAMDPKSAEAAGVGFVNAIVEEMRARQVIRRPKT